MPQSPGTGADIGIALDGDADRVVIADENGRLVDGDQILAVIAGSWRDAGRLHGNGIVATVMSNLGLERHLVTSAFPWQDESWRSLCRRGDEARRL